MQSVLKNSLRTVKEPRPSLIPHISLSILIGHYLATSAFSHTSTPPFFSLQYSSKHQSPSVTTDLERDRERERERLWRNFSLLKIQLKMAATAAAAVATSFSTSMQQSLKSITWPNDHLMKISCARTLPPAALVSHSMGIDLNPIAGTCSKWRIPRIVAAVAQEEAALTEEPPAAAEEAASDGAAAENSGGNTKLYFGNLPYNCDSAQLAGIVQDYASPELVEVLYDMNTGRSRGFAFVTMSSVEECNKVIENLDGSEYGGRTLRVNFSDKPKPKEPLYPETDHKLFVGNLSWTVTSERLKQAFEGYGNVVGARVLYDGETGRSRGYGFVSYETRAEMDTALEALNGEELEGRAMRISLAQGKKQ